MNVRAGRLVSVLVGVVVAGASAGAIARAHHADAMREMNGLRPYTAEAFNAAKADGKTTVLFFHASWCPVCKAQEPKVASHLNGDARSVRMGSGVRSRPMVRASVPLVPSLAWEKA